MAWVIGGRDAATFQRLYDKVRHLENCIFYTDDWDAFAKVIPADRHVVGKAHTTTIEQDNSKYSAPSWTNDQANKGCLKKRRNDSCVPQTLLRPYLPFCL